MVSIYLADANTAERNALRFVVNDLRMNLVGEAADWQTVLGQIAISLPHILVLDWDLLPIQQSSAVEVLRNGCLAPLIVLISRLDSDQQAALSGGADVFICRGEMIERVVDRFRAVVKKFHI